MVRIIILAICCCMSAYSFGQTNVDALIQEGIELHDKQDYEGALKKYDEALAADSKNLKAGVEKSLTLLYMKKYDDCIALCKSLVKLAPSDPMMKSVYLTYGSAVDDNGDAKEAIRIFDKGIRLFPDSYLLYYNKGLTLNRQGREEEALDAIEKGLSQNPLHASAHNAFATILVKNNKIKALLPTLVFLAIEPQGQRAVQNVQRMKGILNSNVQKKDDKNIVINLSPDIIDKKNKDDKYRSVELILSLTSAMDYSETNKNETESGKLMRKLETVISGLSEKSKNMDRFDAFYIHFLSDMKSKLLLETYCHIALLSSEDKENAKWVENHKDKIELFYQWLKAYSWS